MLKWKQQIKDSTINAQLAVVDDDDQTSQQDNNNESQDNNPDDYSLYDKLMEKSKRKFNC